MRQCAEDIQRIEGSVFHAFVTGHPEATPRVRAALRVLPEILRFYAEILEGLPRFLPLRKRHFREHLKALVVAHVENRTGKPRDSDVSALISAATDNPNYSPQAHKAWRIKNRPLVLSVRPHEGHFLQLAAPGPHSEK
jgi:hypothetical protein